VCTVLNLAENSIASLNYCQTIVSGSGYVHCQCGYDAAVARNTSEALAALNGKISVAALGSFVSGHLDVSTIVVGRPITGDVAAESVIVFVAFGSLWVISIFFIAFTYHKMKANNNSTASNIVAPTLSLQVATQQYIRSILPISLQAEKWWLERMWDILTVELKPLAVIVRCLGYQRQDYSNESAHHQQRRELLDIICIATSWTMSCFVMALFYDLQSPIDDGFCDTWADQGSCLVTKTALDAHVNKCKWVYLPELPLAAIVSQSSSLNGKLSHSSIISVTLDASDESKPSCSMNTDTLSFESVFAGISDHLLSVNDYHLHIGCNIWILYAYPPTYQHSDNTQILFTSAVSPTGKVGSQVVKSNSAKEWLIPRAVTTARVHWTESLLYLFTNFNQNAATSSIEIHAAGTRMLQLLLMQLIIFSNQATIDSQVNIFMNLIC
jgi:hypothetical protein